MQSTRRFLLVCLLAFVSASISIPSAVGQVVIARVPVGIGPSAVTVNPVTNKTYVVNLCGNDPTRQTFNGTVTVIDGTTASSRSAQLRVVLGRNGVPAYSSSKIRSESAKGGQCGET